MAPAPAGRYEALFVAEQAKTHRAETAAGLLVHLSAALVQWHAIAYPEYDPDWAALGAPDLAVGRAAAAWILGAYAAAATGACLLALSLVLAARGPRAAACGRIVAYVMRAAFCVVAVLAAGRYRALGWTVVFAAEAGLCLGCVVGVVSSQLGLRTVAALAALALVIGGGATYILSNRPAGISLEQV